MDGAFKTPEIIKILNTNCHGCQQQMERQDNMGVYTGMYYEKLFNAVGTPPLIINPTP